MSRLEIVDESREVIVFRIVGQRTAGEGRGTVVYVTPGATHQTIAAQLRNTARRLDKDRR